MVLMVMIRPMVVAVEHPKNARFVDDSIWFAKGMLWYLALPNPNQHQLMNFFWIIFHRKNWTIELL